MSYYVQRIGGVIRGIARAMQYETIEDGKRLVPQAGWETTPLPDDHPEVLAYLNPPAPRPRTLDEKLAAAGLTRADIKAAIL